MLTLKENMDKIRGQTTLPESQCGGGGVWVAGERVQRTVTDSYLCHRSAWSQLGSLPDSEAPA